MAIKIKRLNVLVYTGPGTAKSSVRHATVSLKSILEPRYAVIPVTGEQLINEPWAPSCALLVFPGGADLGYCKTLNGEGNRRIKQYVQLGGAYIGFCAGGYYGSGRCEFEVGKPGMEVVGDRELGFFPGICRGLAFPGFVYQSEKGARALQMKVHDLAFTLPNEAVPKTFHSYYNGGGVFVDADTMKEGHIRILASYSEPPEVDSGGAEAAVIICKVGDGKAVLSGIHPEVSGFNLNPSDPTGHDKYPALVATLIKDDGTRRKFMKAVLSELGLKMADVENSVPKLSHLHLSAALPSDVSMIMEAWRKRGIIAKDKDGSQYIRGENDKFCFDTFSSDNAKQTPVEQNETDAQTDDAAPDRLPDFDAIPKHVVVHDESPPKIETTPCFDHDSFFRSIAQLRSRNLSQFGKWLLYGEVVTSTSSLLERNPSWLSYLPAGFTITATTQVAARGRGSNVWISPPGSLMFSTVLRQPVNLQSGASVVFVQHIAAIATIAGIHKYGKGYEKLPIKLKWPNDIYALDCTVDAKDSKYVKIGGILVNSSYMSDAFTVVVGIGLNVNNDAPSLSLSQLARAAQLPEISNERLLASILVQFESMYDRFCRSGFDRVLEKAYYDNWLHKDQIVTLEMEDGAKAQVKGITRDYGLLVVEEIGWNNRPTGRRWELQNDGNSFDFFQGLLRKKT